MFVQQLNSTIKSSYCVKTTQKTKHSPCIFLVPLYNCYEYFTQSSMNHCRLNEARLHQTRHWIFKRPLCTYVICVWCCVIVESFIFTPDFSALHLQHWELQCRHVVTAPTTRFHLALWIIDKEAVLSASTSCVSDPTQSLRIGFILETCPEYEEDELESSNRHLDRSRTCHQRCSKNMQVK